MPHMSNLHTALPARDLGGDVPHGYTTLDGTVRLNIDLPNEDYSMDARRDAPQKSISETLTQIEWWGLRVMPEEARPAEVYEDEAGTWVKTWLAAATGAFVTPHELRAA